MLFTSFGFQFVYLPLAWAGFHLAARVSRVAGTAWLVLASIVFYGWWDVRFVALLLISVAGNYIAGEMIRKNRCNPGRCRAWLATSITINLLALGYYKYLSAAVIFLSVHGIALPDPGRITLPLGISFFTFTQIAYLLDVAWGEVEERDPLSYAMFVTFFPHLLAGPILHHAEMMPQFNRPGRHRFSGSDTTVGLSLFILGLAKKILIADMFAGSANAGFAHTSGIQMLSAWQSALSYSIQLYFDFSGYSDMAIGLARMFGIRFPQNFNSPYKAASVIEYWQRWHMTLTRYLTQYLFNPLALAIMHRLSARRRLQGRRMTREDRLWAMIVVPMMTTMGIAGIWHGAGLQFVIFGLLHGVYLSINHAWRLYRPPTERPLPAIRIGSCLLTYLCVLVGAVFFRAASVTDALQMLGGMIGLHGVEGPIPVPASVAGLLVPLASGVFTAADMWTCIPAYLQAAAFVPIYVIIWAMPNTQEIMAAYRPVIGWTGAPPRRFPRFRISPGWGFAIGVLAILALTLPQQGEFIYFQF